MYAPLSVLMSVSPACVCVCPLHLTSPYDLSVRALRQVNGITTQGENMAYAGGMKTARRAYEAYQQRAGREPALPGLQHYSSEQMFWLGAASTSCSVFRPDTLRWMIPTQ